MALLQNIRLVNAEPYRRFGDTTDKRPQHLELYLNKYFGDASIAQKTATPVGYYPPYCISLAIKDNGEGLFTKISSAGAIATTSRMATVKAFPTSSIAGSGAISSAGLLSLLWLTLLSDLSGAGEVSDSSDLKAFAFLETDITSSGEIDNASTFVGLVWFTLASSLSGSGQIDDSSLSLITTIAAGLQGDGEISSADFQAFLIMTSSLSGTGEIDSNSAIKALATLSSTIEGEGTIEDTQAKFYSWFLSELVGNGVITGTMKGWADMASDITSAGELVTAQSCAAAVWSALAASYGETGTMGEKLNDAGSASNPWTEVIEGTYTAADVLKIMASVLAGKTQITDLGGGNATVVFRNLLDDLDRVQATMDGSERTDVIITND